MDNRDKKNFTGNRQEDFAGTNPDRNPAQKKADDQDNPINDQEAQNISDSGERMSGQEAEDARNKASEGRNDNS